LPVSELQYLRTGESQLSVERIKWTGSGVIGMDEFGDFCL